MWRMGGPGGKQLDRRGHRALKWLKAKRGASRVAVGLRRRVRGQIGGAEAGTVPATALRVCVIYVMSSTIVCALRFDPHPSCRIVIFQHHSDLVPSL